MPNYEILDASNNVINTIVADASFVEAHYPGQYRELPEPPPPAPSRRDEILAELATIDAQTTKPRTTREMLLGNQDTIAWVTSLDIRAEALRAELATL